MTQDQLDRAHAYRLHPRGHTSAAPWWDESPDTPSPSEWEHLPKVCARRRFWLRLIRDPNAEIHSHCLHWISPFSNRRQCCRCWCLR